MARPELVEGRDGVGDPRPKNRSRRKEGTTARARKLRQGDNKTEALLWLELKNRKLGGYRFTRQFPIGPYFADFACRERRLVVELDGAQHADRQYDRRRDAFLQSQGYSIMRFWNDDVLKRRTEVCDTILAALDGRLRENVAAPDLRFVFAERPSPQAERTAPQQARPLTQHPYKAAQAAPELNVSHPEPSP